MNGHRPGLRSPGSIGAPSDLGTARFETFLRRLLGVKGSVAPAVEPKLQAGIDLLRLPWELGDLALIAGWRGFESYASPGAAVGNFGVHELRPAPSVVALIERVRLYGNAGAHAVTIGIRDARPAGTAPVADIASLDARYGAIPSVLAVPACQPFSGANNTAIGLLANANNMPGTSDVEIRGPWVLTFQPNTAAVFSVLNLTANQPHGSAIRWWERTLEPSELVAR